MRHPAPSMEPEGATAVSAMLLWDKKHLDVYSSTWVFIREHCMNLLQSLREQNDAFGLDIAQTSAIRGQIAAIKGVLALAEPVPDMETRIDPWEEI